MKLIYLHGVGGGDTDRGWLDALNEGLTGQELPEIDPTDVIAPNYSDLLYAADAKASVPKPTISDEKFDHSADRAKFINRQIEAARDIGADPTVQSLGFPLPDFKAPDAALGALASAAPDKWFAKEINQIRAYVHRKGLRGAVLTRVLAAIPQQEEIVVVGHSLGSVVTVDVLSRLPEDISVRRVVTIGSPAHSQLFAVSRRELIGNFPYARTNSWINFFSPRDPVTRSRGLASIFADVQDVRVAIGKVGHGSATYLRQPAVARAVGTAYYQSAKTPRRTTRVTTALTDDTAALILELNFQYAVCEAISDQKVKSRFTEAIRINRLDKVAQIWAADAEGIPLPRELHLLAEGKTPKVPNYWSTGEMIEQLTILALSDLTAPFDIDIEDSTFKALPAFAEQIGQNREFGETLAEAIRTFNDKMVKLSKPGANWQKWAIRAGVAVIAITPIGLAALTMTPIAGAAAVTGGLAALGPGGVAGGIATIGGTGAAITTAATVNSRRSDKRLGLEELVLAAAVAYTQKFLAHKFDKNLLKKASATKDELSAQINMVEGISDAKAPSLVALIAGRDTIQDLIEFIEANELTPDEDSKLIRIISGQKR